MALSHRFKQAPFVASRHSSKFPPHWNQNLISTNISQSPTQLTDNMATNRDPDYELLGSKIDALIAVTQSGQSFAVRIPFSNFAAPQHADPEAERTARDNMTPTDLQQFDAWEAKVVMPTVDWPRSRQAVAAPETQLMSQRAVAMQRIWNNEALSAEHACWVTHNMANALPLISAVIKTNAAQCDLLVCEQGRSAAELELASIQHMLKMIDVGQADLVRYKADMKRWFKRGHHSSELLQLRKNAIKAKMMGHSMESIWEHPINKKRIAAGLKPIDADINYFPSPTGSRGASRDVSTGNRHHQEM